MIRIITIITLIINNNKILRRALFSVHTRCSPETKNGPVAGVVRIQTIRTNLFSSFSFSFSSSSSLLKVGKRVGDLAGVWPRFRVFRPSALNERTKLRRRFLDFRTNVG